MNREQLERLESAGFLHQQYYADKLRGAKEFFAEELEANRADLMRWVVGVIEGACRCDVGFTMRAMEDPQCQVHDIIELIQSSKKTDQ